MLNTSVWKSIFIFNSSIQHLFDLRGEVRGQRGHDILNLLYCIFYTSRMHIMIITINPSAAFEALVDVLQPDPTLPPYNIWGEHLVKLWVVSTWILLDLSFTEVKSVAVTLVDSYIGLLKVKRNLSQTKNCIQGLLLIYMFLLLLNAISYRIIHFKMCYKRRRLILLKHNMVKGHWSLCSTWETASCSFLAQIFSKAVKYPAESPSLICARAGRPSGALCNPTPHPPPWLSTMARLSHQLGDCGPCACRVQGEPTGVTRHRRFAHWPHSSPYWNSLGRALL